MLKPHYFVLFVSLLADGGTEPPKAKASTPVSDAGTPSPNGVDSIPWPKDLRPLATLDGPAVLAAHAALQQVLSRFPKGGTSTCEFSAKSLDVVVGQEAGLYFVRIDRRPERCGWAPGVSLEFDWFELYAVSPDGRVLGRHPYMP
ncbi:MULTISPECIES: hypothetical protein [Myxococcus]|uniref:hypothetical protein n=1 Tax=Myxococcus TaxID=32 RepID=UPI001F076320|nr:MULTISPECIES: hypothetical protein [Myxococcus]